jgi:serine/threonine protein kinase/formylglycine-generating enzyme required for sulfatase activity
MADTTKTFLGKYELQEVIGDGAEGRVYKAVCVADNVPNVGPGELVAVKRLKSTGHDKESNQFLRQIKILSRLNHSNIVRYKDSFVWREKELEEDIYCLVMELLDGEPLKSLVEKNRGGLPWERAGAILSQALQALQYASKNGVIHRDLKPSNIFITARNIPKLVDFGIARQEDGETTATSSAAGAKGTFDYMAPDFALQHGGFRGDEQSDIFSFGVILYYTLTGSLPFPPLGEHADRGYYIRWLGKQPPMAEYRHPVFRVLSHARTCISKCIELDRQARYKSFDEVMAGFSQIGYRKLKHGSEVYEFTQWLGKGGFGEVFRARRVSDQRDVAVKRLFNTGHSARFVREAKILRTASHPNLTEYVDFVEIRQRDDAREYYLVLEYLEGMPGTSLRDRIKNSDNGLNPGEVLQLFVRYLDCLEHLHQNGIIHRDIKPGNLYAPAGNPQQAKIFDLGIAHDEEGTHTHGQVPGTLDFMPPEFAIQDSGRGSPQSDIYSIGVTLYLSLTKKLPFPRLPEKESDAWVAFIKRSVEPLECAFDHPVFNQHPQLVPLLRRALAIDPKQRHKSAKAMHNEITDILQGLEKHQAYASAVAAGQTALDQQDYIEAERQARQALKLMPSDQAAQRLLAQVHESRLQRTSATEATEQSTAVTIPLVRGHNAEEVTVETRVADLNNLLDFENMGQAAHKNGDQLEQKQPKADQIQNAEAKRPAAVIRRRRNKDIIVWMLLTAAILILVGGLYNAWSVREHSMTKQSQNYQVAMKAGQSAYDQKDFASVIRQTDAALVNRPGDVAATKLKNAALTCQNDMTAQAERDRKYQASMDAGQSAYDRKDYGTAIRQADTALANRPGDVAATKLKNEALTNQEEMVAQAERDRKYQAAMEAGQSAYDQKDFASVIRQTDTALVNRPGDVAATKLKNAALTCQNDMTAQAERDRKYQASMDAGQSAYDRKDYGTAIRQADTALANRPGDVAATKLKNEAQARQQEEISAQAEREREKKFTEALDAGQSAYDQKDYDTVIKQAETALIIRPGDVVAEILKNDAQKQKLAMAVEAQRIAAAKMSYPTMIRPWENSLGMKFSPVAGTKVLFGVWDVRVKDYQLYAQANKVGDNSWKTPTFGQGYDHPVVNVSWIQAKAFCEWLTQKERGEGKIGASQGYRLPMEVEWNKAVGNAKYPWGEKKSPPRQFGNYADRLGVDSYDNTSPVGSFKANQFGLYDMGGNVWQWCEDEYSPGSGTRVLRGASWRDSLSANLLSSYRYNCRPESRSDSFGFRLVLCDSSPVRQDNP